MAVVLAATGAFLYVRLAHELDATIDASLRARAADLAASGVPGAPAPEGEDAAQILDARGAVVAGHPANALVEPRASGLRVIDRGDDRMRILATRAGDRTVVVGATLDDRDEAVGSLGGLLLVGGPIALLLASLAGYGAASGALRLHRLETAFARERAFVADASHELRSPLAVLRAELELALKGGRSPQELEAALRSAAEETDRLSRLAEDLLLLARMDEGRLPIRPEEVLLADFLSRFRGVELDVAPGARVHADPLRLEQALGNLVDNARRHGAGTVCLSARNGAIHVLDGGPGFPDGFTERAFDRFSRGDAARGRGGAGLGRGGAGLGLAIVAAIARAHGGRAGAANRPGGGADVWIEL